DLLLVDITSVCSGIVDGILNISKVIAYSPAGFIDPSLSRLFHIPASPSYVPTVIVDYSNKMTFFQRLHNSLTYVAMVILRSAFDPSVQAMYEKLVNSSFKSYGQLRPSMLIVSTDFAIDYPRPITPATKVVGALLPHAPLKLPQELSDFAELLHNDSQDFAIVSFGTLVSKAMDNIIDFQAIGRVLSRLPMKVIWKYHHQIDDLGDNVKVVSWFPQNDLLAHRNCKLFVTHCGLNSMYESAYHGVPMVAVPLFADQPSNAQRIKSAGIGEIVLFKELNEQSLNDAILKVYKNPEMATKCSTISNIMRDRPGNRTPVEEVGDWIEFAIRHDGGRHLNLAASQLRWYELYMIDV
ncbi:uncharacterized protein TRIADDRAFT_3259, partial [Trichoplax adhaerens]